MYAAARMVSSFKVELLSDTHLYTQTQYMQKHRQTQVLYANLSIDFYYILVAYMHIFLGLLDK